MKKLMAVAAAALACAGCFDNKGKPEDVPTVIGVAQLASADRAGIVRVILRGDRAEIPESAFSGLDSVKMIDLSERGTAAVSPAVFAVKGVKEFYFARNGMVEVPDFSVWADSLDYLNLDGNAIAAIPAGMAKLSRLKWLRLNKNRLKDLPPELSALTNIRRIYLKDNALEKVPEVIREWRSVEDVALDGNPIKELPDWLLALPNLRGLSLSGTRVSKLPEDLAAWKRLDFLSLGGCPVPKAEMQRIRQALPDVAVVF